MLRLRRTDNLYAGYNNFSDTWYRFEHDAGNRLVERPVEPWHCGTEAPIWMNGTHPTGNYNFTAPSKRTEFLAQTMKRYGANELQHVLN